ncbi:MAG TPA: AsmA-like C-terminal domain-containing protein [Nitrospira sp.]|nr:AsmA-like C-terminal domain-containing protein [Nitrospira sp.]
METGSRRSVRIPRWFLVLALLILLIPITTLLLNHSTVHHRIRHYLQSHLGIEVSAIHLQLVPSISLEVFGLLVRDDRTSEPILQAPHASLTARLWPLIIKQTSALELRADEPMLVIRRDSDGIWHVPLVDGKRRSQPSNNADSQWMMTAFHVVGGNLVILDEERLAEGGVRIHHVRAVFESNKAQTQAEVALAGKTEDGGDLQISGVVALGRNAAPDTSDRSGMPVHFEGTLQFQYFDLSYWLERMRQSIPAGTMAWRGNLSAAIRLDVRPDMQGSNVSVSQFHADLGWLLIRGDGSIEHAGTADPRYTIRLATAPIESEIFFTHIPSSWIPKTVRDVIDEHDVRSTVELLSVGLSGSINVLREPEEWNLVAKLSHGAGVWGEHRTRIEQLSATVAMDPRGATFTDLAGEINGVRITSPRIKVSDLNGAAAVEAHLVGVGKMEHMLTALRQLDGKTASLSFIRNASDITGTLRLTVHVAGPILPKPSLQLIQAGVQIQDLGGRLANNYSVAQLNGSLEANSRVLEIKHIQGMMQGIRFEANGAVDLEAGPRLSHLTMHMWADGTAIQELFTKKLGVRQEFQIEGATRAMLSLSGTKDAAHCRSTIDLSDTDFMIPSILHKKKGARAVLDLEGNILGGERIHVESMKLVLFENQVRAAGQIELSERPKFHVQVKSGPISVPSLVDMGVSLPMKDGTIETAAAISGEGTDWKAWTPSGWVTVQRGVAALPGLDDELSEVSGRVQMTARGAVLNELSFKMGDNDVKLTGVIEHWRHDPRATFMLESSHLDVAKLLPKTRRNSGSTGVNLHDWVQSKGNTIGFLIDTLQYERLVLRTISGEIKVDPTQVALNGLRGETPKGVLSGYGKARLLPNQQVDVDAELEMHGVPAQDLLPPKNGKPDPLQGSLSLKGAMRATVDAETTIQDSLTTGGPGIMIKVMNGRLQQDPVLTKVLTIMNIPAVLMGEVDLNRGGIPFHSITARMVARNGRFSTEDIVFDSPIIKATGAGTMDVKDNGLDLALAVSPLATYSHLLGKIPLFAELVEGDHAGLSTALFEIKGSFSNPEVAYLPLESFGKGLTGYPRLALDVLANTIRLPHKALAYATQ